MFDGLITTKHNATREPAETPTPQSSDPAEIKRYFQECYPIMLDGALPSAQDRGRFLLHAKKSLSRGWVDPKTLPSAVLRETLESLAAEPPAGTGAGITAIGPRYARVWWDKGILNNLDDVLSRLDKPRLVLRFYDVTGVDPREERWHDSFDIDVSVKEAGRTVQFWSGDKTYIVDLGYIYADGRFLRLARTNTVDLPRDCPGSPYDGETVRSVIRTRQDAKRRYVMSDAAARDWIAARGDDEARDIEAELIIHMLYRAFLLEGPRALRRAPILVRRDEDVLGREFRQRQHNRDRAAATHPAAPVFLVARLDGAGRSVKHREESRLVPAIRAGIRCLYDALSVNRFAWYEDLRIACGSGRVAGMKIARTLPSVEVTRVEAEEEVVTPAALYHGEFETSMPMMAAPVFEAARDLHQKLAGLRPVATQETLLGAGDRHVAPAVKRESADANVVRIFGGAEAKRMAKAGVRFTRMALTLEGRMRPGARLKVAGKLVHADKNGNFRLECVLSGRRASIPMRAGTSISGEARSLINVDWEKRPSRESKQVNVQ